MNRSNLPVLGWAEIDRQHSSMVEGFRFLRSAPRRHRTDVVELKRIVEEVRDHFVWEEAEMACVDYPEKKRHSKDHEAQLSNLLDLLKYVEEGQEQLDEDFFQACLGWNERHIRSMDADFVQFAFDRESWDLRQELANWEYEGQLARFAD